MRQHNVQFKLWAAFAVALSMSIVGSALVYQVAKLLTVPMHFDTARVQAGVPSFGCCHLCARPYACSRRLVGIEVLHDTAIACF